MAKNGTIAKWILVGIAVAGIIWNAAILHNEVSHIKEDVREIKDSMKEQKTISVEILKELRK